ncbi:uncharacterized protein UV8b_04102 [Ustilaginoidea virens]|uniref:RRM domain-containing protein n=1 Tax=Ustilaginoidea virens TaxID=1159556 RepID=A0A8E5MHE6_USTVR|nr:uncharacterized protein UV8b_04102 [Ustilaginoidea virens]QUC19861.1 hypothetical protein UV8b_04102 [Ustilaginoidea virens]
MAEADFEIDFYGDATNEQPQPEEQGSNERNEGDQHVQEEPNAAHVETDGNCQNRDSHPVKSEEESIHHGTKRKPEEDHRPVDSNSTAAIMISELNWWTTDDDIRGWMRKAECEDEVKELTFSEHKVNGKSKGQVYVELESRQAATAAKRFMDKLASDGGQAAKKLSTSYWNASMNPFKTLPKDAPARGKDQQPRTTPAAPYNERGNYSGGFRGRGGFGINRGNMNQNNYNLNNPNRNFNNNSSNMGFNSNMGGGFNGPMGGGNFGFNNRGNMMGGGMRGGPAGMRGNRGGGNMMGMGPMGGMPMGMPANMGMMGMGGGMPGFQGMAPNFGAGFGFGQNQGGGGSGDWGNPHGAKRPRPE